MVRTFHHPQKFFSELPLLVAYCSQARQNDTRTRRSGAIFCRDRARCSADRLDRRRARHCRCLPRHLTRGIATATVHALPVHRRLQRHFRRHGDSSGQAHATAAQLVASDTSQGPAAGHRLRRHLAGPADRHACGGTTRCIYHRTPGNVAYLPTRVHRRRRDSCITSMSLEPAARRRIGGTPYGHLVRRYL